LFLSASIKLQVSVAVPFRTQVTTEGCLTWSEWWGRRTVET